MRIAVFSALAMSIALPASAEEAPEARRHFNEGRRLEAAGSFSEALSEYERANELSPAYRLHRYMGRMCQELTRHTDAIEHYEQFLADGGRRVQAARRREVENALREARQHVVNLTIETSAEAMVSVDSIPMGRAPLDSALRVNEGQRTVTVNLDGYQEHSETLTLEGGVDRTLTITLDRIETMAETAVEPVDQEAQVPTGPAEEERRGRVHRAWFWSGLALSLATLTGGAVLGGLALGEQSAFDNLNVPQRTDADEIELDDITSRGETMSLVADVLLFTGAAFAVTTLILAFFTDFQGDRAEAQATIAPFRANSFTGLSFQRRF